eukprot:Plantae.Rhodophyta-Hildenbrandia_rubra.ctg11531.p2 GENE.Plantae.Rhodophyta-Hildenbrandia_rubra.ctg11531~~Plantae.Rhodophyta-Hildenbrandia_rubra.ctg11531.p2  ORF type:complete len:394 (+),score=94.56 Plantae.Rhodophyta-Hildenbrandia_rubra.ctg11531:49-1182(+)
MSDKLWLVSAPNEDGLKASVKLHNTLDRKLNLSAVYKLSLPSLRVGTLDSLISVSDALSRDERSLESVVDRILRQYRELSGDSHTIPLVDDVTPVEYVIDFEWDEAKFASGDHLAIVRKGIMDQVGKLEEDLKLRVADWTAIKQAYSAIERKGKGTLMVKDLSSVVDQDDVIVGSEHLVTAFVVCNKYDEDQFLEAYEGLADLVVPRSAKKIEKDDEYVLYGVTVFKKGMDDFKAACRDKRFTVREFTFDAKAVVDGENEAERLAYESKDQLASFTKWAETAFAEAFSAMVHIKAVRAFVESVLRYGLPVDFEICILVPRTKSDSRLRSALKDLYGHLGGSWAAATPSDDVGMIPGVVNDKDFYPYVYVELPIPRQK